jgi:hypothetical protein
LNLAAGEMTGELCGDLHGDAVAFLAGFVVVGDGQCGVAERDFVWELL